MRLITARGNAAKEDYKTRITYLDEPKQQLRTKQAKLDHVVIAAAIRQWHRQSVQISDACFVHLLLLYSAHAVIKWIQIWRIWMPQLRWNNFCSFFLRQLNGSTCEIGILSQGSVEIIFR